MDLYTCRISSYHKIISSKKCITYILRMSNLFGVSIQIIIIIMKIRIGKRTRITDTVVRSSVQKTGKWQSECYQPQAPYQLWVPTEQHQTCPAPQPQAALARAPLLPTSFWFTHLLPGTASTSPSRVCATAFLSQFSGFPPEITFSRLYKSSVFFIPEVSRM